MLVIALGYSLGRVSVHRLALGPAGATLLVGLVAGWWLREPSASTSTTLVTAGALGFALFIYSVGFDAAPHFFASFRERRGWRFVAVGAFVNGIALATALVVTTVLDLSPSAAAGMLAGALTSPPTYAAASEIAGDPATLALSFAITYPVGLVVLVVLVQVLPRLRSEDLTLGAASDEELEARSRRAAPAAGLTPEVTRSFLVRVPDSAGKTLAELNFTGRTGCVVSRVHRGSDLFVPAADTVLLLGDRLLATGRVDELALLETLVGPETHDAELSDPGQPPRRIEVLRPEVAGRSLRELDLGRRHHCVVTRVERGRLLLEPGADLRLQRRDVVEAVGRREDLRHLARALGRFARPLTETDVAVYAGGIVLGLLLGSLRVAGPGGADLGLGWAGGLLLAGLLLGSRDRIGPLRTHVPLGARQLVRDLGILLFIGERGLAVGGGGLGPAAWAAWPATIGAVGVTVATVVGGLVLARRFLGLRPLDAWGAIAGGLTSSAALQAVRREADSPEAAASYAAAYAVASILATLAGPLLILLTS